MDIVNTADGTPVNIEPGSLKSEVDTLVTGLRDGRYRVVETRRDRFEQRWEDVKHVAVHVLSALILYVAPATVIFVAAGGLQRRVRGGAR